MLGGAGAGMAAGTGISNGGGGGGGGGGAGGMTGENKAGAGAPPGIPAGANANGGGSAGATPTLAGLAAAGILYDEELDPSFLQRSISAPPTDHAFAGAERGVGLDYYYYYQPNNLNPRLPNNGKQQQGAGLSPTLTAVHAGQQQQQQAQHHQPQQGAPGLSRDDSGLFAHFPQPSKPVSALVGEYLTGLDGSAGGGAPSASASASVSSAAAAAAAGNPPSSGALEAPRPVRTPSLPPGAATALSAADPPLVPSPIGPSLQDAMKAKSLIELIQDDFPRTPSPVFPHSGGHSANGHSAATAASVAQAISLGMATAASSGSNVSSPVRAYPSRSSSVPLVTSAHPHPHPPPRGPAPHAHPHSHAHAHSHHPGMSVSAAASVDVLASTMQGLGLGLPGAGGGGAGGPSGAVDDLMLDAAGAHHHHHGHNAHAHAHAHAHHVTALPAHHPHHPGHIRAASANDIERHAAVAAAAAAQRGHGGGVMYQVHDPSAGAGEFVSGLEAAGLGLAGVGGGGGGGGGGAGGEQVYFRVAQAQGPYGRQDVVYRVPAEYVASNGDIRCVRVLGGGVWMNDVVGWGSRGGGRRPR
jgi:hypothetical protein